MKKSILKGASIFLASVLTVGMCSAYSVNAKAKFSLPKKTTLSYDKKNNGGNGFYTNVIYIKGTNRSNSEFSHVYHQNYIISVLDALTVYLMI